MNPEAIRKRLQDLVGNAHDYKNVLPQVLEVVIDHELWKTLTRADGTPFATIGEFLTTHFPHGTGVGQDKNCLSYGDVMKLCQGYSTVVDVLARNAPKGKRGGSGSNQHKKVQMLGTEHLLPRGHAKANTTPVLQAKLAEHHPQVWADFIAGKHKTVNSAAVAAGLVKDSNDPLKRLKENWRKASAKDRKAFLEFLKGEGVGV